MPYEKFIWLYLQEDFDEYRKVMEIKEKKSDKVLVLSLPNHLPNIHEL